MKKYLVICILVVAFMNIDNQVIFVTSDGEVCGCIIDDDMTDECDDLSNSKEIIVSKCE